MSDIAYYDQNDRSFARQLRTMAPQEFQAYRGFSDVAVGRKDGVIPPRYRELIAIAVGLTTQCAYCIETHTAKARGLGVSPAELAETIYIAAALRAGAAAAHGMMAMKLYEHAADDKAGTPVNYHESSDRTFAQQLRKAAPAEFAAYRNFSDVAVGRQDGSIEPKYRELIAVAVGLTTQCAYCLETHTAKARKLGVSPEELAETVYIAAALRAGAAAAHGMMALKLYQNAAPAAN
ncbi:MAG: carboxymuconolactone decarboxylase family protein [Paralcaligenes sp.]